MKTVKIITNNPLVVNKYHENVEYLDAGVGDVLVRVRDYIHSGARLLNHPLSGGVAAGISPVKSLIIEPDEKEKPFATDLMSLGLIENAIERLQEAPAGFGGYNENTINDFETVDLDLLDSAMISINKK